MTHRRTAEAPRWARRLLAPAVAVSLLGAITVAPAAAHAAAPGVASASTRSADRAADTDEPPARRHVIPDARIPGTDPESETEGAPAAADDEPAEAPSVRIEAPGDGVLAPGAGWTGSIVVDNPAAEELPAGVVSLSIGDQPLEDRAALDAWLGGKTPDGAGTELSRTTIEPVGARGSSTVDVTVAADADGLADLPGGVYPLRATFTAGAITLTGTSVVIVADDDRAPVGVIVPLTAPPTERGLLDTEVLTEITGPGGSLTRRLDAVAGTEAVLAVDPAIPAAIRALGTSAPASALEWLSRLEALPNERFALQFGDADPAIQVRAGLDAPMAPTNLRAYERGDDFLPSAEPSPSATAAPQKESSPAPVYPTLEELLDIGQEAATIYWPAEGSADSAVVETLGDDDALTLLPSSRTTEGADGAAVGARTDAALVYDHPLSEAVTAIASGETPDEDGPGAGLVRTAADLWFASREVDGQPLLLTLGRLADDQAEEEDALGDALDLVTANRSVSPVGLDDLAAAEAHPVTLTDAEPEAERIAAVTSLTAPDEALKRVSTVLDEPEMLTGQARAEALQLLATGWTGMPDAWRKALTSHEATTAERLDAVRVQLHEQVQLFSAEAPLPVWVHNNLAWPITVVLLVHPDDARLDVRNRIEVQVPAGSNPRVEIPVEARVGSGDVQLEVTLLTPTGEQLGPVQTMDVAVRAEWERIGLGVLIGIISLLVVGGIIRTVLRRRARTRAQADEKAGHEQHDIDGTEDASDE